MAIQLFPNNAEVRLVARLDEILSSDESGWQVLYFPFSRLLAHYRGEYQMKIALNVVADLLSEAEGALYVCTDCDLFLLMQNAQTPVTEKVVFQLRYLMADDPLAYTDRGEENPGFYSLHGDDEGVRDVTARARLKLREATRNAREADEAETGIAEGGLRRLTSGALAELERGLQRLDIGACLRHQPVCALLGDRPPQRVFEEVYIHIAHLRHMLGVNIDLTSERWLFKYLTVLLDHRVLRALTHPDSDIPHTSISLNLNLETLLSEHFTEFNRRLPEAWRTSLVIELQLGDIFTDMKAFHAVRNQLHDIGYRLCLDGVSTESIRYLDRKALDVDLVKIQWSAERNSALAADDRLEIRKAVDVCGARRIILCRCDNDAAIRFGQAFGISLYQGRHLDRLLNPDSRVEN